MKSKRLPPSDRKAALLACALGLAAKSHYSQVTRAAIASAAGVSPALVSTYLGTMPNMRRLVMRAAVATQNLAVVAQGLSAGDRFARGAPDALRAKAAARLAG